MSQESGELARQERPPFKVTGLSVAVVTSLVVLVAMLYGGCAVDMLTAPSQAKDATKVVERFMQLMAAKRTVTAESLFDGAAGDLHERLQSLGSGPNYALFDGYRALTTEGYGTHRTQGCIMNSQTITLRGSVAYDDGSSGTFNAVLSHDSGEWEILDINVIVPPAKILKLTGTR